LQVQIAEHVVTARAGSFVFASPNTPHTFANFSGRDARILVLCAPAGFEPYFDRLAAGVPARRRGVSPSVVARNARVDHMARVSIDAAAMGISGLFEETGCAATRCRACSGASARCRRACCWACVHLPLWLIPNFGFDGQSVKLYIVQITALSVSLAWLYNATGGNVLLTGLAHGAANAVGPGVASVGPRMPTASRCSRS
jgi:hypothetical protein